MMDVKSLILDKKLIAILRNVPADHVIEISKALQKGGISIIEVGYFEFTRGPIRD